MTAGEGAIELIVFDKDGTLVDLHRAWGRWAELVVSALDHLIPAGELARRLGWRPELGRIAPETPLAIASNAALQTVIATWLYDAGVGWSAAMLAAGEAIAAAGRPHPEPICPLAPLFETLSSRGVRFAVVTTDDRAAIELDVQPSDAYAYLSAAVGGDEGFPTKPAPEMLLAACAAAGVSPSRTMMVGDSIADLLMGHAAGVALTVGVLSGGGTAETLAALADVLVPSVADLAGAEWTRRLKGPKCNQFDTV